MRGRTFGMARGLVGRELPLLVGLLLFGCGGPARTLVCEDDEACVRSGMQGTCVEEVGYCAFPHDDCGGGLRWDSTASPSLAGRCVAGSAPDGGVKEQNPCGGTVDLPGQPGEPCGACETGTLTCDGPDELRCTGARTLSTPIAFQGGVSASTIFNNDFKPELSVDGDFTTSWFSKGPEDGGAPTIYEWVGSTNDCLDEISVVSNAQHDVSNFRTDYGFGQVTIQVFDAGGDVVFSETHPLPGTPDPDITVRPGVIGRRVRLLLLGHEDPGCGGFSELVINALR